MKDKKHSAVVLEGTLEPYGMRYYILTDLGDRWHIGDFPNSTRYMGERVIILGYLVSDGVIHIDRLLAQRPFLHDLIEPGGWRTALFMPPLRETLKDMAYAIGHGILRLFGKDAPDPDDTQTKKDDDK